MSNPPLNERRLRYFHEVYRQGSIRGAADRLGIEPSVISRQLQQLENDLGLTLFERRGRGIAPTDMAAVLADFCRERQADEETLLATLRDFDGLQRGLVRLVVGEGFMDVVGRHVLDGYCRAYPNVEVRLDLAGAADAVRMIRDDEAHIGLGLNPPADPAIEIVATRAQPLRALAAPGHALAGQGGPITLAQAAAHRVGLMEKGYGLRQLAQLAAFSEDIAIVPAFTCNSIAALKRYAMSGLGITFLSETAAEEELREGALVAIPIRNPVFEHAQAKLFVRRRRALPPAARRLIEVLRTFASARCIDDRSKPERGVGDTGDHHEGHLGQHQQDQR